MCKFLRQFWVRLGYPYCLSVVLLLGLCSCIHRDWGRGIKRVSFIPDLLAQLAESDGKAVPLSDAQKEELFDCLRGPVKRSFMDNKYISYQSEIWAIYWQDYDGKTIRIDRVYLVRYSLDDSCYDALVFDSNGRLTEAGGGRRGFASYDAIDKGPIR